MVGLAPEELRKFTFPLSLKGMNEAGSLRWC
jgi:hypothetical protein